MELLPERAQSLEEWREKIFFPGGFREWCIRMPHPGWRLSPPTRPESLAEQEGWYDAVMHERYYPRYNNPSG